MLKQLLHWIGELEELIHWIGKLEPTLYHKVMISPWI